MVQTIQDTFSAIATSSQPRAIDNFVNLLMLSNNNNNDSCKTSMELVRNVTVTNVKRTTNVDLTKIHCSKTGQPIATLDASEIDRILSFYGVTRIFDCAEKLELASGVSRIWLNTDPDTLNRLQAIDPKGFFCYCINIALQNQHMVYNKEGKKKFATIEVQKQFRNSLVQAWYQLDTIPLADLHAANQKLRHFMYLDLHNKKIHSLPWHFFRIPTTDEEYNEILKLYSTGTTYRAVGKYGNKAVMVNPDHSGMKETALARVVKEDLVLTNQIRTTQQHFLSTHGVNNNHVLPHELACQRGIDWIVACLDKFLQELKFKLARQEVTFHSASAFRRNNKALTKNEIMDILVEVGEVELDTRSLEELKKEAKLLAKDGKKGIRAKSLGLIELIDLDLKVSSDGSVTTNEERGLVHPTIPSPDIIKIPSLKKKG